MSEAIARLVELDPPDPEQPARVYELRPGVQILGRDPRADVTIKHDDVSRHHAELSLTRAGGQIRDLGSKNGLKLDGRAAAEGSVGEGAVIAFGELALRLEYVDARVDRVLARSGELTLRRPRAPGSAPADESAPPRSVLLPLLATALFAALLIALMVFG